MSYHLIETIFINLPITTASQLLWQLILSADGLEAFNHYFQTNNIKNIKQHSFSRQISLRTPQGHNHKQTSPQDQPLIKINQEVVINQKEHKITYQNIPVKQCPQVVTGEFFHQLQQNNKGQTYLIFGSSMLNQNKPLPQKSQAQIQLIKIKDLLQNGLQKTTLTKSSYFTKCC